MNRRKSPTNFPARVVGSFLLVSVLTMLALALLDFGGDFVESMSTVSAWVGSVSFGALGALLYWMAYRKAE